MGGGRDGIDHIRVDFLSMVASQPQDQAGIGRPVPIDVGDETFEIGADRSGSAADQYVPILILDHQLVIVSVPVPDDGSIPAIRVHTPTSDAAHGATGGGPPNTRTPRPVWLMIVNYCIQGLDNGFEVLIDRYADLRTYTRVTTMRDEARHVVESARRRGGRRRGRLRADGRGAPPLRRPGRACGRSTPPVLTMIAHDCPDEFADLQADVARELGGAGQRGVRGTPAHPCSRPELSRTWRRSAAGTTSSRRSPWTPTPRSWVYSPDQRLYGGTPQEYQVYAANRDLVRYLVLDRSTLAESTGRGRHTAV